ncbi:MAG: S41 family peptidase [Flavobacteriales bacterium]|nr:MAG: S41 family peptidase [Flavobacteriales bacterium]
MPGALIRFGARALLSLTLTRVQGQPGPFSRMPTWSPEEAREDLDAVVKALKAHHPALYRYCTPEQFERCADSLRRSLDRPCTEFELLNRLAAFYPLLGDGHTLFLPTEEWAQEAPARYFPLPIAVTDSALYLRCSAGLEDSTLAGARVQAINGVPATAILDTLITRQVRDGLHTSYAIWVLDQWFRSYYRFSYGEPEQFTVQVEKAGERQEFILRARSSDELPEPCAPPSDGRLKLTLLANKAAVLRIPSFAKDDLRPAEIDAAFDTLRTHGVQHLVLDLRGDQGGEPRSAKRLLAHLLDRPFRLVRKGPHHGMVRPLKNHYTGALCTLMDGGSFSVTAMVLAQLEAHQRGPLIGSESGGCRTVISGCGRTVVLPNTRITCTISRKDWWLVDAPVDGRGVQPIHPVATEVTMPWRRDAALEKALELLGVR